MRFLPAVVLLTAASCQKSPPVQAEPAVSVPAPSSLESAQGVAPPRRAPPRLERTKWREGLEVTAVGKLSDTPWQHVVGNVPGKSPEYFDLASDDQTVIYIAGPIECPGKVEVEARVMEVSAASKRPSKSGERYSELHLDVTSHRCLP